jgi:hypothetical protein
MKSLATVPAKQEDPPKGMASDNPELVKWQRRLLPLMTRFIVAMAAVFFCFSAVHLYQVSMFIGTEHGKDIRALIESEVAKPAAQLASPEEVLQDSLLLLEADALDKRYHQANALLLSRIWSRQLAFITGMVMAFLGAVFILGKLSESTSNISGGNSQWQVGISSASPGIILSFFGTVLLVTTLLIRATLDVSDGPAYVTVLRRAATSSSTKVSGSESPAADSSTRPLTLEEMEKLNREKSGAAQTKK